MKSLRSARSSAPTPTGFSAHHLPVSSSGACTPPVASTSSCSSNISCFRLQGSFNSSSCSTPSSSYSSPNSSCSTPNSSSRRTAAVVARAAASSSAYDSYDSYAADNFYQILGVPESASRRDIKRAYKAMMRDFHPDLSGDEESTEFCVLLNDIYETLMDPERRATYDALAGFSAGSINPFADVSLPADQVFVDELSCIGCRNCTNVCPRSFAIEDDFGRARVVQQGVDSDEKLQEAIDTCPVNCIHWVTASQLSLLEATMVKMERVGVVALMSGGGGGRDVFTEASISWEKRQAEVRAKLQQEADANAWTSWWDNVTGASAGANMYAQAQAASRRAASGNYSSYDGGDGGSGTDTGSSYDGEEFGGDAGSFNSTKEGARIAKLAAKAARAARQWKTWQELQQRSRRSGLLIAAASVSSGEQQPE